MADLKITLLLFFLLNLIKFSRGTPCNGTANGTLCAQNETDACFEYKENPLTLDDKNYLVRIHTSLRENMTKDANHGLPKAFFMKKLSWSDSLAKMAQKWAEKCKSTKQPNLQLGGQPVGQLILVTDEKTGKNLRNAVAKWTDGLKHLNQEIISKYRKSSSGSDYEPAAQILWWNTTQFGCGRSSYKKKNCDAKSKDCGVTELVCNYFPAGNKEGESVYKTNLNNLICQHSDDNIHCKTIGEQKTERPSDKRKNKGNSYNRIMNRMMELWPAAAGASSVWYSWNINFFYIIFFYTLFTTYIDVLHVNLKVE